MRPDIPTGRNFFRRTFLGQQTHLRARWQQERHAAARRAVAAITVATCWYSRSHTQLFVRRRNAVCKHATRLDELNYQSEFYQD